MEREKRDGKKVRFVQYGCGRRRKNLSGVKTGCVYYNNKKSDEGFERYHADVCEYEDVNTSYCYGVPNGEIIVRKPATVEQTCAIIVNRIPDVINAEPGYVTTSRMPVLKYRIKDLNYYCK